MASKELVPLLIALMLLTGVCNTLLTKYQDNLCVRDCNTNFRKGFEQPVIQTLQMFVGEMGSWVVIGIIHVYKKCTSLYNTRRCNEYNPISTQDEGHSSNDNDNINLTTPILRFSPQCTTENNTTAYLEGWRVTLLALPAICDICGTTLMNVGLLFVVPSIYQMTRGALVLFVGFFSVIFLKKTLYVFQWFALATVVFGVAIVGLAGASHKIEPTIPAVLSVRDAFVFNIETTATPEALRTIIGVFLIAGAQVFSASQFVLEEFILENYSLQPLKVVGWEGLFGFSITVLGMIIMYIAFGRTPDGRYGYFDIVEGWREITQNKGIAVSSILIMISIGSVLMESIRITLTNSANSGFNYFGLSVTQNVSATTRSTIDTCRTLFIWIISLFLGWETFKWLQVIGFSLLIYGTFLFNNLIRAPFKFCDPLAADYLLLENDVEQQ